MGASVFHEHVILYEAVWVAEDADAFTGSQFTLSMLRIYFLLPATQKRITFPLLNLLNNFECVFH